MGGGERRAAWGLVVAATVFVALVAAATAAGVHHACFHPPPPVSRPDPGTPRGHYCDAINASDPWLSLTVGPMLLMLALGSLLRRRPWWISALAVTVAVVLIANTAVANQLESALTI
jgi:hypothetical protein